jgi:hypothetical protein
MIKSKKNYNGILLSAHISHCFETVEVVAGGSEFNSGVLCSISLPLANLVFGNDARLCYFTSCLRSDALPE